MNIVPLSRAHHRGRFDCGEPEINKFLREGAFQDQILRLSRTSVLIDEAIEPTRIMGFHTLLMAAVDQELIPADRPRIKRKIPVILLGQLAVEKEFQNQRFGNLLLSDVEIRVKRIAEIIGLRSLTLDARTERLADWYEKRDFIRFPGSLRMFKSLPSILALVE